LLTKNLQNLTNQLIQAAKKKIIPITKIRKTMKMNNLHPIVAALASQQTVYLAVQQEAAGKFLTDLNVNMSNPVLQKEEGRVDMVKQTMARTLGASAVSSSMMYGMVGTTAVIPVFGALVNRFNSTYGFITGYNYIKNAIATALADESVDSIILDINSGGGEVAGCFETVDYIKAARSQKEIHAVVDSSCYSAAYAIASACTSIKATPSSGIGSVGVVAMHASYEKMLENEGISVTFIKAGDHKVDGNPYEELSDSVKADMQKRIDATYQEFVSLVSVNRSLAVEDVVKTQAACYTAQEAKSIGLIDDVISVEGAVKLITEGRMSNENTVQAVDTKTEPQAQTPQAPVAQADANAERSRIQSIITAEAAKNNSKLAHHLAFNTNMSVEDAIQTLAAAAQDVKEQPVAQQPAAVNLLADAMAQTTQPNVGADVGNESEATKMAADIDVVANFLKSNQ
jgi:signal peptide peptidase SppA